jgi:hypothetical protein
MSDLNDSLVFAATAGNYRLVRDRVEAGADPNHSTHEKGSALYAAIRSPQCVSYLLSKGADPNYVHSESGLTVLDQALAMIPYYTAQSAWLIRRAGGVTKNFSVLPAPCQESMIGGRLLLSRGDWFRFYSLGQVCFGEISRYDDEWLFDGSCSRKTGHFFRIEALYFPDRLNLQGIERTEEGFFLVDFRSHREAWTGDPDELDICATISLL